MLASRAAFLCSGSRHDGSAVPNTVSLMVVMLNYKTPHPQPLSINGEGSKKRLHSPLHLWRGAGGEVFFIMLFGFALLILQSCTNIMNTGDSLVKERAGSILSKDDSTALIKFEPVTIGKIQKPKQAYHQVICSNTSLLDTLFILGLTAENDTLIKIKPVVPYPIQLLPNQSKINTQIQIIFLTDGLAAGKYSYKIFVNQSTKCYITLTVEVVE